VRLGEPSAGVCRIWHTVDCARIAAEACRVGGRYALFVAQRGEKHESAKPLKGFGAGVLEIVSDHRGDTFRAVYTVRLGERVFVLHAFQKKSRRGMVTPQAELEMIKRRLKRAVEISEAGV
jgi:phage-related protein